MKIKSITVKNFRSCPDGTYALSNVNALIGKNGRGKTSLQMALRYLLSGHLPEDPVCHGKVSLMVSGILDDGQDTEIAREYFLPDRYLVNGTPVKEKDFYQKAAFYKNTTSYTVSSGSNLFFRNNPDVALTFLLTGKTDGYRISGTKEMEMEMSDGTVLYIRKSQPSKCLVCGRKVTEKAYNSLLEDRMQGKVTSLDLTTSSEVMSAMGMPDFAKYLFSIIPVKMDYDKLASLSNLTNDETKVLSGFFPPSPQPVTTEDVAKAYKEVYAVRTALGRQLKEWEQRMKYDGFLPLPSKEFSQSKLEEFNKKLGAAQQINKALDVYKKRIEERNCSIETYKTWVTSYNALGRVEKPNESYIQELKNMEQTIRENMDLNVQNIAKLKQSCIPLEKMLSNLDTTVCPLCDSLVCNTDKTACKKDISESIFKLKSAAESSEQQLTVLKQQLQDNLAKQEDARNILDRYQKKLELYKKINELRATIPEEPKKPDVISESVDELTDKAKRYSGYLQQAAVYENCQDAQMNWCLVKKQYDLYNDLVRKTEPKKGLLTNTILNFLLTPFRDHVNGFTKSVFSDTEIDFRMGDTGLEVVCRPHGRNCFLPLGALSDGERMLAVFTLMDMVASIAGTGILVFDRLETMDEELISNLLETIQTDEVKNRYDHILIASVEHEDIVKKIQEYSDIHLIKL